MVVAKAEGVHVWDPEGRHYYDFLAAYSAVNQGHRHPRIIDALVKQAGRLTICSRAFYSDSLGPYEKYITELFGYEMVLPMNTGAEAVETALKLARKWGYARKGISEGEAIVLACAGNFHGRTLGVISMSTDPDCRRGFGPFLPNVGPVCPGTGSTIRFNSVGDLREALRVHGPKVAAFLVEPIQGEAGYHRWLCVRFLYLHRIHVPDDGYLRQCYELCKEHNVLFMADEIQSGLGRAGTMLAVDHEGVRPDVLILGKALSGGVFPVSAVLADRDIMLCIQPGEHGSTYGGNPLGCAVALAGLKALQEDNLVANSAELGAKFRAALEARNHPAISDGKSLPTLLTHLCVVRGRGLMNAIDIDEAKTGGKTAWDLCMLLKQNGLITKPTHEKTIRLTPPLCITEGELQACQEIIFRSLDELVN